MEIKELKSGQGYIRNEELEALEDLGLNCIFAAVLAEQLVVDVKWLKEKIDEADEEDIVEIGQVIAILTANFGDDWKDLDLIYLWPE